MPKLKEINRYYGSTSWQRNGYIASLVVAPEYRGHGLARKLAAHWPYDAFLIAVSGDCNKPLLTDEQLITFYQRLGFKIYTPPKKYRDFALGCVMFRGKPKPRTLLKLTIYPAQFVI